MTGVITMGHDVDRQVAVPLTSLDDLCEAALFAASFAAIPGVLGDQLQACVGDIRCHSNWVESP